MDQPWLSHWPEGVPRSLEYPEISLGEMLRRAAVKVPHGTAIWYQGLQLTYGELDALADRFGQALQGLGIAKGDRVAVYLPNLPQFVIAYYGALRIGAVVVSVSPLYKDRELSHVLGDSGARILVAWDRLYPIAQAVRDRTRLHHVITTNASEDFSKIPSESGTSDARPEVHPDTWDMKAIITKQTHQSKPVEIRAKEDLALLQYSGGTTGPPKGAMLTHYNLVVNVRHSLPHGCTWLMSGKCTCRFCPSFTSMA